MKLAEETLGRYDALTQELSDPNIFGDQRRYAGVAKEHARMCGAVPSSPGSCWRR